MNTVKRLFNGAFNFVGSCLVILFSPVLLVFWFVKDIILPLD